MSVTGCNYDECCNICGYIYINYGHICYVYTNVEMQYDNNNVKCNNDQIFSKFGVRSIYSLQKMFPDYPLHGLKKESTIPHQF